MRIPSIAPARGGGSMMVAWRLAGKRVLVVGGGNVAAGRVRLALEADARVSVVSPELNVELRARLARDEIVWLAGPFQDDDVLDADLVLACLDDEVASARVAARCRALHIPVNCADKPEHCDFWFPAVHREGPVQIAVSTGGNGPALAQRLRDRLARSLPSHVGEAVALFGELRHAVRGAPGRMKWLSRVAHTLSWDELAGLDVAAMAARIGEPTVRAGRVVLVGAGPGDPDLLTLAAARALAEADLVIADRIVAPEILALVRGELRIAGKEKGRAEAAQAEIDGWMIDAARAGKTVVRLKCGDPYLLGRGGEEVELLEAAGVPVQVIPGVSAAFSAPSAAGIPVTRRGLADRVLVTTATGRGGATPEVPAFSADTTVVVLMGVHRLAELAASWQAAGWPADWPVAVVEKATRPEQRVVRGTLADIAERAVDVQAPATIVVGRVAARAAVGVALRATA